MFSKFSEQAQFSDVSGHIWFGSEKYLEISKCAIRGSLYRPGRHSGLAIVVLTLSSHPRRRNDEGRRRWP